MNVSNLFLYRNYGLILCCIVFFCSCEVDRVAESHLSSLLGLLSFLISTLFVGVPALVLSVQSVKATETTKPFLAIAATILYGLFFVFQLFMTYAYHFASPGSINTIFIGLGLYLLVWCTFLIRKGYNNRKNGFTSEPSDLLDD